MGNFCCYLVFRGRVVGLFESWRDVAPSIEHYNNFCVRGYSDADKAFRDWEKFEATGQIPKRKKPITINRIPEIKAKMAAASKEQFAVIKERARATVNSTSGSHTTLCTCGKYPACMCSLTC